MSGPECVFLVADKNMETVFQSFLAQPEARHRLVCRPFHFDLIVATGKADPGIHSLAHEYLRGYASTHRYAVVVLDAEWAGAPAPEAIREKIAGDLCNTGWDRDRIAVIVIDPELENWIWMNSPHVAQGLGWTTSMADLRTWLNSKQFVFAESGKPERPKEAIEAVLRHTRKPRSSARYGKIVQQASIKRCTDPAFAELARVLQQWFP